MEQPRICRGRHIPRPDREGIGIAPDVLVVTSKDDLRAGKDAALEKAIELSSK